MIFLRKKQNVCVFVCELRSLFLTALIFLFAVVLVASVDVIYLCVGRSVLNSCSVCLVYKKDSVRGALVIFVLSLLLCASHYAHVAMHISDVYHSALRPVRAAGSKLTVAKVEFSPGSMLR